MSGFPTQCQNCDLQMARICQHQSLLKPTVFAYHVTHKKWWCFQHYHQRHLNFYILFLFSRHIQLKYIIQNDTFFTFAFNKKLWYKNTPRHMLFWLILLWNWHLKPPCLTTNIIHIEAPYILLHYRKLEEIPKHSKLWTLKSHSGASSTIIGVVKY